MATSVIPPPAPKTSATAPPPLPGPSAPSTLSIPFDWTALATAAARAALRAAACSAVSAFFSAFLPPASGFFSSAFFSSAVALALLLLLGRRGRDPLGDEQLGVAVGDLLDGHLGRQVGVGQRHVEAARGPGRRWSGPWRRAGPCS